MNHRRDAWVENLFRPLAVGIMAGCIALSLANLIHLFLPTRNGVLLVVGCVLAALEAQYSYRIIKTREIRSGDITTFRVVELATIFILLKIGSYLGDRWIDVLADIRAWPYNPIAILFDAETVVAFTLALLSWLTSTLTARDLNQIGQPPERIPNYISPREHLANRFFWGGIVLLIIAGIVRLGAADLLNLNRPSAPGIVLNVLVYFLLGLAMLGQAHFTRLYRLWQSQKIQVTEELAGRWARYSLIFIGLAAAVAFLLPTGYTFGLLEIAATIISAIGYIFMLIGILLSFLLALLMIPLSWLFSNTPTTSEIPPLRFPPPEVSSAAAAGGAPDWWEILRSLLFWVAALGMVTYIIRSYLHDHPELLAALTSLKPIRFLRRLLAALWRRLTGLADAVGERLPRGLLQRARREPSKTPSRFFRLGALSPRERILYYYLSILRRAGRLGLPRRRTQTPHEYDDTLGPHIDPAQREMSQLTQAFVKARYSRHTFDREQDKQTRARWQRVKAALRALRREKQE